MTSGMSDCVLHTPVCSNALPAAPGQSGGASWAQLAAPSDGLIAGFTDPAATHRAEQPRFASPLGPASPLSRRVWQRGWWPAPLLWHASSLPGFTTWFCVSHWIAAGRAPTRALVLCHSGATSRLQAGRYGGQRTGDDGGALRDLSWGGAVWWAGLGKGGAACRYQLPPSRPDPVGQRALCPLLPDCSHSTPANLPHNFFLTSSHSSDCLADQIGKPKEEVTSW